jgi:hypothetical protein
MGSPSTRYQVIHIHAQAPAKPALGAACNGCGVCCLAEPCPVGMVLSRRRHGACVAVTWVEQEQRYRCGVAMEPLRYLPRWMRRLPAGLPPWFSRVALRFIAAGKGCDSDATLE